MPFQVQLTWNEMLGWSDGRDPQTKTSTNSDTGCKIFECYFLDAAWLWQLNSLHLCCFVLGTQSEPQMSMTFHG